jgi:hypothetical protein
MEWIWIHPYCRRQGLLSKAWPEFEKMFPGFEPDPPLSPAMQAFVAKMRGKP